MKWARMLGAIRGPTASMESCTTPYCLGRRPTRGGRPRRIDPRTTSTRRSSGYVVEGHELAGWESAEPLSDATKQKIDEVGEASKSPFERRGLDQALAELEGNLLPICTRGGQQHTEHKHLAQLDWIDQQLVADMAAAALVHPPRRGQAMRMARNGCASAEHVETVGLYDGGSGRSHGPTQRTVMGTSQSPKK